MTNDEILQAAKEAGMAVSKSGNGYWDNTKDLERFAAIIEKRTIERCALVCETLETFDTGTVYPETCAAAIRKLGEQ